MNGCVVKKVAAKIWVVTLLLSGLSFDAMAAVAAMPSSVSKPVPATRPAATQSTSTTTTRVLIASSREARLSALMEGRLTALPKRAGATFNKGNVLAEFDCSTQKAELLMAAARLDKMQRTLDSQIALGKLNAISDLDLALAHADLAEAKARHQQASVSIDRCTILAPYHGRVVRRIANQFETLPPGSPILEIVESGTLRLEMLVPSRWLSWLKAGQAFVVHIDELNRDVPARITVLGSRVDPVSQTISIQGEFTQPVPGVLPGMSGSTALGSGKP